MLYYVDIFSLLFSQWTHLLLVHVQLQDDTILIKSPSVRKSNTKPESEVSPWSLEFRWIVVCTCRSWKHAAMMGRVCHWTLTTVKLWITWGDQLENMVRTFLFYLQILVIFEIIFKVINLVLSLV